MPLVSPVVIEIARAASSDQGLFRHLGKRREVTNLDWEVDLRPDRDRQEAFKTLDAPL